MNRPAFPIEELLPRVARSLAAHPRLVLEAPPGAGKTTQVPPVLLDADWLGGRKIVMLEPRRIAARAAAGFMAARRGEVVGATIGYRIRFESKVSARTRIEVVTEGILTRMIQDDPSLETVGAIVFDEFHERHLASDLGLALALDVQAQLRPDLRLVVMSATLDGERLAQILQAPRLSCAGRSHPVAIAHVPTRRDTPLEQQVRRTVEHVLAAHPGDVLVFLPGQREIAQATRALSRERSEHAVVVLPLHGELPVERQSAVLASDPQGRRRVVLATNVAESSVTLPGVRVVVDVGLAREPRYDPNSGFSRLHTVAISQASADQRAGRAGRVAQGWAYRLWPASRRLEPQRRAEIVQVELASLALELAAWGEANLRFVDPPPPGSLAAARELLQRLGALDDGGTITAFGRRMLALGTHPRLAAMLLTPRDGVECALACDLAALIEARDPLRSRSDAFVDRWHALAAFRSKRTREHHPHPNPSGPQAQPSGVRSDASRGSPATQAPSLRSVASIRPHPLARGEGPWMDPSLRSEEGEGVHWGALAAIDQAARQWRRRRCVEAAPPDAAPAHLLGDLLLHAFPDRIAHQHATDPRRYQLANGRMARLGDESALYGEPWLAISELRLDERDALILRAAPLDEARLAREFPQRFVEHTHVRWDADRRAIVALRERRFDAIVLETKSAGSPDPARHADALVDAVRQLGLDCLPWSEPLTQWRARVRCLRDWMPELALPDLADQALLATLEDWLKPVLAGRTRLDSLSQSDLAEALKVSLPWPLRQRIDALAPERILVPSGMQRRIEYRHGEGPVLAVKLQELFGLADTPRIAAGRVPLTIHLLSPAGRPLQVTQDLRGFWERTYPELRREMQGRYPKHPWPADPWSAVATHRSKPRGG